MANELDIHSDSAIQPYDPGMPVLAPLSPDSWGSNTDIDLLREDHSRQPQDPTIFGSPMPAGTSPKDIQAAIGRIGGAYFNDMTSLSYPTNLIQSAIQFFSDNATKSPQQVARRHNFALGEETGDPLAEQFGNYLETLSGTKAQKQQFLNASLLWLKKLNQQLGQQQVPTAPRMAPNSEDLTANLTDAQFNQLVAHNNTVLAQTLDILQQRWGQCFKVNIELAQAQLNKQTPAELALLDRYTGSWPWTHMFNTVELLTAMYDMAIGAGSIGVSGADIAKEIAQFEAMLKIPSERAKYMKDPQLQARLRELYQRRDG